MSEITDALNLICEGRITEIRLFDDRGRTHYGYFDNYEAVDAELQRFRTAKAVYFIPNEINADLLARSANAIKFAGRGETTGDQHVIRRRWFLIDLDPCRVSGVSSTDAEKEKSLAKARVIFRYLQGKGFCDPVVGDSGNGTHLLYRINEPPDDDGLLERCLKALAQLFSDVDVDVDQKVFNPARIFKLYGTMTRKGSDVPLRPHRQAKLLRTPEHRMVVTHEQLQSLADDYHEPAPPPRSNGSAAGEWTLEQWMREHSIEVLEGPIPYRNGRKWKVPCPFNEEHVNDAALFDLPDGVGFTCLHNSCSGNHWREYRQAIEPGCYDRREPRRDGPPPPTECEVSFTNDASESRAQETPAPEATQPTFAACAVINFVEELTEPNRGELSTGIPRLDAAIGGGLGRGELVIVAARPSHGKSMFALQMTHHLSEQMAGLVVSEEMSVRALSKRMLQFITPLPPESWRYEQEQLTSQVHDHFESRRPLIIEESLHTAKRVAEAIHRCREEHEIGFAIVDYVQLLGGSQGKKSRYETVTEASIELRQAATDTGVTIIALAQLNREIEKRTKLEPHLSDLKESGQLEQDADVVLGLLWPHMHDKSRAYEFYQVFVLKNRNRATTDFALELAFEPNRQRLNAPRVEPPPYEPSRWEP